MSGPSRFWWRWLLATGLLLGGAIGVLLLTGGSWHFWPLLLLVAFTTSVLALVSLCTVSDGPDWTVDSVSMLTPAGQDSRLGMYTQAIVGHLDARVPDPALRDRLADLADRRLRQRHGLRLHDDAAADLLGTDAFTILTGTSRRLSLDEIGRCVRQIEEL
ncbi:MAG: hypothetical protein ABWZ91_07270 [Nocardioides sp.]